MSVESTFFHHGNLVEKIFCPTGASHFDMATSQHVASVYGNSRPVNLLAFFFFVVGHCVHTDIADQTAQWFGALAHAASLLEPIKIQRLFFLLSLTRP